tara:strand:- start:5227 stop:5343 length:117 start_codon:yes stop_codon:yes gene_type:complete
MKTGYDDRQSRMINEEEQQELLLWIKWLEEINNYRKAA